MTNWKNLKELISYANSYGVQLEEGNTEILSKQLRVEGKVIPNRLLIQPVEGADAQKDGSPSELTKRRYLRYAKGGAGTIWIEAVALNNELRSNDKQLVLSVETLAAFTDLVSAIKEIALTENGYEPVVIAQLSHPGRSCIVPKPAYDNEMWELIHPSRSQPIVTDEELERLAFLYGDVAYLAKKAGIDGVEVKACHRFFINELLAARNRTGRYGGSYENRVRHLKESISAVREKADNTIVTVRLNHYDGIPFPNGFGMKEDMSIMPDSSEPLRLIKELYDELGVELINCSSSSPIYELFETIDGNDSLYSQPMNQIKSGGMMHKFAKDIKQNIPEVTVVATMFSHLRQYAAYIGAGMIERKETDIIGFGRQALAYPNFANDILKKGRMNEDEVCICCNGCHRLMGLGKGVGCTVRDEYYRG